MWRRRGMRVVAEQVEGGVVGEIGVGEAAGRHGKENGLEKERKKRGRVSLSYITTGREFPPRPSRDMLSETRQPILRHQLPVCQGTHVLLFPL